MNGRHGVRPLRRDGDTDVLQVGYTYGDDLISQTRQGVTSYYHYDGQMSTRQLTDNPVSTPPVVTDSYTYDAFGNLLTSTGPTTNNYLYTGEQYDPNVGFYYLRARYYNQAVGRFINRDPFGGSLWDPVSLHKYQYANADPVNNADPTGLVSFTFTGMLQVSLIVGVIFALSVMAWTSARGAGFGQTLMAGALAFLAAASITAAVLAVAWGGSIVFVFAATGGFIASPQVFYSFRNGFSVVVRLSRDLRVYRWFGGTSPREGHFWTSRLYSTFVQAREALALQPGNTGVGGMVTTVIKKGTEVLVGWTAPNWGLLGGGPQVWIKYVDPSKIFP